MRKYRLVAKKGEGTFSEVLKAQNVKDGKYHAIKCMKNRFESIDQVSYRGDWTTSNVAPWAFHAYKIPMKFCVNNKFSIVQLSHMNWMLNNISDYSDFIVDHTIGHCRSTICGRSRRCGGSRLTSTWSPKKRCCTTSPQAGWPSSSNSWMPIFTSSYEVGEETGDRPIGMF